MYNVERLGLGSVTMQVRTLLGGMLQKLQQLLPKSRHSPFGPNTGNFATNGFEMAGDFKKTRK